MRLIVGVLALVVALPGVAGAQDVTALFDRAAASLDGVREIKGKKIGVGTFPLAGGRASELGSYLADQLDVALTRRAGAGGFEIVTRNHLCQIIREHKLWVDDQFAQNKKLGGMGQADFMVTGQVTPLANQLSVSLRMLDTETGRAVWADSLTLRLDEGLKGLLARPVVGDGCGPEPAATTSAAAPAETRDRLQVKISTDKPSYRIGDTVRFGLRVNRDAYVTLVNIGTSGDITIIYPNRFHPSHFVRAGQDVAIPPPDAGFTLTVQGPAGFDQVRAIATEDPVQLLAGDFAGQSTTFRSLDRVQTRSLVVTINAEREKVAPARWAEDVIAIEVKR